MKVIAVFSAKGGVGKTALAVNLAHAAATAGGRRTLLWDLDAQGAAGYILRCAPRSGRKARAAISGDAPLGDLVLDTGYDNLDLLPADRSLRRLEGDFAQSDKLKQLRKLVKGFEGRYDRLILDCPPGLSGLADRIFRAADLIVQPVVPAPLSERAVEHLRLELLRSHDGRPPVLPVWSMVDARRKLHREAVQVHPGWPAIPYAAAVEAMSVHQRPIAALHPGSSAARAFAGLWARVEAALAGA